MKHFNWRWLAASSLLLALAAAAQTRPQYGATVRVALHEAPTSLDPADAAQPDSFGRRSLTLLMFDTLVMMDATGHPQPSLAVSWQASQGSQRWQFHLRRGVRFHDGSAVTAESVAASLRAANPSWNVSASSDSVMIARDEPDASLLVELTLARNAIVKKNADGTLSGTGSFRIATWQPGKKLTLAADENCWRGRPFLDAIEIEMGRSFRDQTTAIDVGKADLVEVAPEMARRLAVEGRHFTSSLPVELIALSFSRDAANSDEKLLREALALSIDRSSIRSVLLQGAGQSAASILPEWMSGYGFVFSVDADLARARHDREQVRTIPTWTIGYDAADSIGRLLAERIALNARDAGLSLQPSSAAATDLRVVRIPLSSADPWLALNQVAAVGGLPTAKNKTGSVEELYAAEQSALAAQRLIPLFHLPVTYVSVPALRDWGVRPDGTWNLDNAWLEAGKP
jgi:peptide/nickel transport system substrate-binding protein